MYVRSFIFLPLRPTISQCEGASCLVCWDMYKDAVSSTAYRSLRHLNSKHWNNPGKCLYKLMTDRVDFRIWLTGSPAVIGIIFTFQHFDEQFFRRHFDVFYSTLLWFWYFHSPPPNTTAFFVPVNVIVSIAFYGTVATFWWRKNFEDRKCTIIDFRAIGKLTYKKTHVLSVECIISHPYSITEGNDERFSISVHF